MRRLILLPVNLLDTPGIANVQINEHMERQEIKKGLDFGNTTD